MEQSIIQQPITTTTSTTTTTAAPAHDQPEIHDSPSIESVISTQRSVDQQPLPVTQSSGSAASDSSLTLPHTASSPRRSQSPSKNDEKVETSKDDTDSSNSITAETGNTETNNNTVETSNTETNSSETGNNNDLKNNNDENTHLNTSVTNNNISSVKKFKASSLSVNKKFLSQSGSADGKLNKNHHNGSPRLTSLTSSSNSGIPSSAPRLLTGKIGSNHSILNASGSGASGWAKTPSVAPLLSTKSPEPSHPILNPNPPDSKNRDDQHGVHQTGINGFLQAFSTNQPGHSTSVRPSSASLTPSPTPSATLAPQNNTSNPTPSSSTTTTSTPAITAPTHAASSSSSSSSPWVKLASSTRPGLDNLNTDFPTAQEVAQHTKLKAQSMAAAVAARDKVVQDRAAASAAYNQQLLQTLDGFRGTHLDPNASHWDEMEDEDDMFGEVVEFGDGTQYKVTEITAPAVGPLTSSSNGAPSPVPSSQTVANKTGTSKDMDHMPPFLRARAELKSLFNERIGKFEPYSGKLGDKTKDNQPSHVHILQRQQEPPGDLTASPSISSVRLPDSNAKSSTNTNTAGSDRPSAVSLPDTTKSQLPSKRPLAPITAPPGEPPRVGNQTLDSDNQVVGSASSNDPLKYRKPDLDELHRAEMTSAAERARKRRQEEETAREADKERARHKAVQIEAQLKAAADAAHKKSKPTNIVEKVSSKNSDSWRSRAPPSPSDHKADPETSSPEISKAVMAQTPTDSLAKKVITSESSISRSETKTTFTRPSSQPHTATPLPPQDAAFRNRADGGAPSGAQVWKSRSATAPISQLKQQNHSQSISSKQPSDTISKQQGESKPASRSDGRQPAPHLLQDVVHVITEPTPKKESAASPRPQALPTLKTSNEVWPLKPSSSPSPASPILPSSTNRHSAPEKYLGFKLPEMSQLDTVMSRIKVVLEADKEARSKAAATANNSPDPQLTPPAAAKPKDDSTITPVKQVSDQKPKEALDNSIGAQPSSSPAAVYVAGRPRTLLPRTVLDSKSVVTLPKSKELLKSIPPTLEPVEPLLEPPQVSATLNSSPDPSHPTHKKPTTVRKAARFDIPPTVVPRPIPSSVHADSLQKSSPKWVNRDPIVFFDATRQERPSSPVPAWKAFTVKFGSVKPKPRLPSHLLKYFWNPLVPAKVNVLTWDPPMTNLSPKTLSRDDLLFRKKYIQGIVVSHVQFPKDSISTLQTRLQSTSKDLSEHSSQPKFLLENGSLKHQGRGVATQVEPKNRVRGRADETISWRRPVEEKTTLPVATSTTVPLASSPIDVSKESVQPTTAPGSKSNDSNVSRRSKSKIPEGCKVAFQKPANLSTPSNPSTTGMFMVNSEITGEEPESVQHSDPFPSGPKQSSPNSDVMQTSSPMTTRSRDSPPPVTLTPRSTSIASMGGPKGSTSSWTKSPLAFSVLDSHTKNVWSQPDGQMTATRAPSGKTENSLKGIADDFPATLPRTLNDFNAEEEPPNPNHRDSSRNTVDMSSGGNLHQNAGSSTNPDLKTASHIPDDQAKANGLVIQPAYMNSPAGPPHYNNELASTNPAHIYPHHNYSSTPNFPVPPGYQLVPIGCMQTTQTTQYPPIPAIYPAQASAPWSPSLGPVQPNGYASSPQLYSPHTNYPSLVTSSSAYPSHAHSIRPNQILDGSGFSRSPGPIAPRGGSRVPGPTGHLNRPPNNETNNFGPNVAGSHDSFSPGTHKRQPNPINTMTATGPNYHLAPATTAGVDGPSSSELGPVGRGYGTGDGNFSSPFHPPSVLPLNIHHSQQQQPTPFNQVLHHGTPAGGQSPHMIHTGQPHIINTAHVHHHHHQSNLVGLMPPPPPPSQHHYLPPTTHQFHPTNTSTNPTLQPQHSHGLPPANNELNHLNPNRNGLMGEIGHPAPHHSHHPSLGYSNQSGVSQHQNQHSRGNSSGGRNNNINSSPSINMNNNRPHNGYNHLPQHHGNHRNLNPSVPANGIHLSGNSGHGPNNHNVGGMNGLYNPTR